MRLFLAINLPTKIKKQIDEQLTDIKLEYPDFKWVTSDNFHITVHFFGEREYNDKLKNRLSNILYDQEKFYLYSTDVDLFMRNKIVIYLNFRRERKLEKLVKKISINFINNPKDIKRFVPHMSLARCRIPSKQQYFVLKKRLKKLNIDINFRVNKLTLFESILGDKPVYKKIQKIPLITKSTI